MGHEQTSYLHSLAKIFLSALLAAAAGNLAFGQEQAPKAFQSPDLAAAALIEAAKSNDLPSIVELLGPEAESWIRSGDEVQDEQGRKEFVAAYDTKNEIEPDGDDRATLVVGEDGFPFPIPVVKTADGWVFDAEEGKEELLNRRIGRNELNSIQALLAIADAQFEYAQEDRNGNGLREYATKFRSSEGKRDGLFWPTEDGEPPSPLGELAAQASAEGYDRQDGEETTDDEPSAYHGYRFKLLQRQGADAPGGAFDYVAAGSQIGGFAVIAYPATYGNSGIMTFQVNHEGVVYEADLGEETAEIVAGIDAFDPGSDWGKVDPLDWQLAEESVAEQ
jgi:hypothetical protein